MPAEEPADLLPFLTFIVVFSFGTAWLFYVATDPNPRYHGVQSINQFIQNKTIKNAVSEIDRVTLHFKEAEEKLVIFSYCGDEGCLGNTIQRGYGIEPFLGMKIDKIVISDKVKVSQRNFKRQYFKNVFIHIAEKPETEYFFFEGVITVDARSQEQRKTVENMVRMVLFNDEKEVLSH